MPAMGQPERRHLWWRTGLLAIVVLLAYVFLNLMWLGGCIDGANPGSPQERLCDSHTAGVVVALVLGPPAVICVAGWLDGNRGLVISGLCAVIGWVVLAEHISSPGV